MDKNHLSYESRIVMDRKILKYRSPSKLHPKYCKENCKDMYVKQIYKDGHIAKFWTCKCKSLNQLSTKFNQLFA